MRGQLVSQVLAFILAAAVLALILLYGWRAISEFTEKREALIIADFKRSFAAKIDEMSLRYGSVDDFLISLPGKYTEFCVVHFNRTLDLDNLNQTRPALFRSWLAGSNVFILPGIAFSVDRIEVENGSCCLDLRTKVRLRLEGLGRTVLVGPWNTSLNPCKP